MVFRPVLRSQVLFDVIVAVLLTALIGLAQAPRSDALQSLVVVVLLGGALALRRTAPGLALVIAWVGAIAQMVMGLGLEAADFLIAGVMYTTSAYGSNRTRWWGLASAFLGAVVAAGYLGLQEYFGRYSLDGPFATYPSQLMREAVQTAAYFVVVLAILLLPWLAGLVRRVRSAARMSREAQLLAERDAARADRAVAVEQERVRIARDMHDIVAHSLAVVIAQADGARYALKADPDIADQALTTISGTARRALGDVRELLGALRHEQGTAPTPEIDDIEQLVTEMRDIGLDVDVERDGDPSALPTTTQLAVYRIVQESLTNAYKHGQRGTPVHARLTYRPDTVEIQVVNERADDGRAGPGTGHGLVGMRERATMTGGTMTAGPRGDAFVVAVRMPAVPASGQMPRDRITSTHQEHTAR
ncbi:sensor histidine kinase [Curtobacterium luteum]|nr:sensor histidine kinase [Curtobacterium luteum]